MNYGGLFDLDNKIKELSSLEEKMLKPSFWDNKKEADNIIERINILKNTTTKIITLKEDIINNLELLEITDEENLIKDLEESLKEISSNLSKLEILLLLNGPYDKYNCILEIHSGAGGTEACDWANMLYRMYLRWCEKKDYKTEVINFLEGEEVGIKSVSIKVTGPNAYGYLKNEKGIHRLVRLSPFDSAHKRHTSFASVEVIPEFKNNDDFDIKIDEKDLKIDVYRSSGAGGQHVNTTDSAVRITHLPTKIVVTCQNGRSQLQNKEEALLMLKSKLKLLEIEKRNKELNDIKGEQKNIEFGSQIRSYVMHPYSMVKDHRTNYETSNVNKVLDGDIDIFLEQNLKKEIY